MAKNAPSNFSIPGSPRDRAGDYCELPEFPPRIDVSIADLQHQYERVLAGHGNNEDRGG